MIPFYFHAFILALAVLYQKSFDFYDVKGIIDLKQVGPKLQILNPEVAVFVPESQSNIRTVENSGWGCAGMAARKIRLRAGSASDFPASI